MNVYYKCTCLPAEVVISVVDRKPDQDIVDWVGNTVANAIGADHRKRSPMCAQTAMEYAKFEVDPGGGPLGTITRN